MSKQKYTIIIALVCIVIILSTSPLVSMHVQPAVNLEINKLLYNYVENSSGQDEQTQLNNIQHMIRAGADINFVHSDGNTLLHAAIKTGRISVVRTILLLGARLIRIANVVGITPLQAAAATGNHDIFSAIFSRYNLIDEDVFRAILPHILLGGNTDILRSIISSIDQSRRPNILTRVLIKELLNNNHQTALLLIAGGARLTFADADNQTKFVVQAVLKNAWNTLPIITYLLGLDFMQRIRDVEGNNVFTIAAKAGKLNVMKILRQLDIHTNVLNKMRQTALHCAVISGIPDVVEYAYRLQPDALEHRDNNGFNPLMLAVVRGLESVVEKLISLGANPHVLYDGTANTLYENANLLHLASTARGNNRRLIHYLASIVPSHYINAHTLFDTQRRGLTPLMVAARNGNVYALHALLANRASSNYVGIDNNISLLDCAVSSDDSATVKCILKLQKNNLVTRTLSAALVLAARHGKLNSVRALHAHNSGLVRQHRNSLLEFARHNNDVPLQQFLERVNPLSPLPATAAAATLMELETRRLV